MKGVIIFKSQYGSTAQYAKWLSETTHFALLSLNEADISHLKNFDIVVIGSLVKFDKLSAGKWIRKNWPWLKEKKVLLFSVSAAPTDSPYLRNCIRRSIPKDILALVDYYPLPGRLDRKNLNFWDDLIVRLFIRVKREQDVREKMKGFDQVDFVHLTPLQGRIKDLLGNNFKEKLV